MSGIYQVYTIIINFLGFPDDPDIGTHRDDIGIGCLWADILPDIVPDHGMMS